MVAIVIPAVALMASSAFLPIQGQRPVLQTPVNPGLAEPAPQPQWTIFSESMAVGDFFSPTWTFDVSYDLSLQITDLYVASDRFEVYDNGNLILTTPAVLDWDGLGAADAFVSPPFEYDPNQAFSSGLFSAASTVLGPGPHAITIRDIHIPPTSAGGPAFADGSVAFKVEPVCTPVLSALPGVVRDTTPPQASQMLPFSQNRIIIGAGPGTSVAPPDVQFFPANPGAPALIVWAIASQPAMIPLGGLGTFLVSVSYPDPFIVLTDFYPGTDVLTATFVPNACVLIGAPVYTQGAVIEASGPVTLTNALDYLIGLL